MKPRFLFFLCLWAFIPLNGRDSLSLAQQKSEARKGENAPTRKEILRLLFTLQDTPLKAGESCAEAGTSLKDHDLGDYMSGWLAELKRGRGSNWITAEATPATVENGVPGWKYVVMFRHVDGEERWGWGVSVLVRASDRSPVRDSITCVGAG